MNGQFISRNECKTIQLEILKAIATICKESGINYSLGYGTLIGAVRHKGFIPWDDDIDIFLLRDEYVQLIQKMKEQTLYPWISILDDENTVGYYYPFAKAVDNRTVAKMEDNLTPHGIWVDIFPVDGVPNDESMCISFLKKCALYRAFIIAMTTDFSSQQELNKATTKKFLSLIANIYGKEKILDKYKSYIQRYPIQEAQYAGCLSTPYINKERFPIEWYKEFTTLPFEEGDFQVIKEYKGFLTKIYGDYMELPPEGRRKEHHITAWYIS